MSARRNSGRRATIAATIASLIVAAATYFSFAKGLPFQDAYVVKAAFTNVNQLEREDEVRIGGLRVGLVTDVQPGPDDTVVATMEIDDRSIPIRTDATATSVPRLVLEGNDHVELSPGSPAAPELESGATLPVAQTDRAVQLDQVLNVLEQPTRKALTNTMGNLAEGLGDGGLPLNQSGSDGLRDAVRELDGALASVTSVANAAQGTQTGDLRRAVASTGDFTAELAEDPRALADVVTNYNRTFGALAARDTALAASVRNFDELMGSAPADLEAIGQAMPVLAEFAEAAQPGVEALPATLRDFDAVLEQLGGITRPEELRALLTQLQPVLAGLPPLQNGLQDFFGEVTPVMQCISQNVIPVLNSVVPDPVHISNRPVWQDLAHSFSGFAGLASSFDGNGSTVRLGITESEGALEGTIPGFGETVGLGPEIQGVAPVWLGFGVDPPWRPDEPCTSQALPDLAARLGGPPQGMRRVPLRAPTAAEDELRVALLTEEGREDLLRRLLAGLDLTGPRRSGGEASKPAPNPATPATTVPTAPAPTVAPEDGVTPAPTSAIDPLRDLIDELPELPPAPELPDEDVQDLMDALGLGGLR